MEWLNTALTQILPQLSGFVESSLQGEVELIVQGVISNFKIEEFNLGTVKPEFTNIVTHEHKDQHTSAKSITIDFNIDYDGDMIIMVSALGVPGGIKNIKFHGRGRVVLKPTSKEAVPFFVGGLSFCLTEAPQIDFDLSGVPGLLDTPDIKRKLIKDITDRIIEKIVFPHNLVVPLSEIVNPMSYKCFAPIGMLAVKVMRASNLPTKDGFRSLIGQAKPDAYAKSVIGAYRCDTKVIKNEDNPNWGEESDEWFEYLLETLEGHRLNVRLFDHDTLTRDDFLGEVFIDLSQHVENDEDEFEVTKELQENPNKNTEYQIQGDLTVILKWMTFGKSSYENYTGNTKGLLTIFVYSCNNLTYPDNPEKMPMSYFSISFKNKIEKSEIKKNNPHPTYNHGLTFKLDGNWNNDSFIITSQDHETNFIFGEKTFNLQEIFDSPMNRKIMSFSDDNPVVTLTISANIKLI